MGFKAPHQRTRRLAHLLWLQFCAYVPSDVVDVTYVIKLTAGQLMLTAILFYFNNRRIS